MRCWLLIAAIVLWQTLTAASAEENLAADGIDGAFSDAVAAAQKRTVKVYGAGIGRRIVERLIDDGRALGLTTVFALTLQEVFFQRLNFRTVPRESFPGKVWADCRNCPKLHACDEIAVALTL